MSETGPKWETVPPHLYSREAARKKAERDEYEATKTHIEKLRNLSEVPVFGTTATEFFGKKRAKDTVEKSKILESLKEDEKILDIGGGMGHIAEQIAINGKENGIKVFSADPFWRPTSRIARRVEKAQKAKQAGKKVNEKLPDNLFFLQAKGEQLPIKEGTMDAVSLYYVLHHIKPEQQKEAIEEVKRILKPDGKIFLVEDVVETEEEEKRVEIWDRRVNFEPKEGIEPHFPRKIAEWEEFFNGMGFDLIDETDENEWSDKGKKNEGIIRHKTYIFQRKKENGKS